MPAYDPNSPVPRKFQRVRKLLISVVTTGIALVTWFASEPHTAIEVAAAVSSFVGANLAIYLTPNAD